MDNLQGLISKQVNNMLVQFEALGYLSNNVSNTQTTAYKSQRFENYLKEDGRLEAVLRHDYVQGTIMQTGRDLDVAINGAGFIPVIDKNGQTKYTRDGSFRVTSEGTIVTRDNCIVGGGINLPADYNRLKIQPNGKVMIQKTKTSEFEEIGEIPLVTFRNPEGLKVLEGNKVEETNDSGKPIYLSENKNFKQHALESSNVDMYGTVQNILQINASLIASKNLTQVIDDMYKEVINLRQ